MNDSQATFFGHPRGLATLFFTEMFERYTYYGMRALLTLFLTAAVVNGGFGMTQQEAGAIYGIYTGAAYLFCVPGGWVADRIIGQQRAVWYGGILIAIGNCLLAIPAGRELFYLGLLVSVSGVGLLKPNVSAVVGALYKDQPGYRRDAGFSIFYMGINLGAFIAPLIGGPVGEKVSFRLGFLVAAIAMIIGVVQFRFTRRHLGDAGSEGFARDASQRSQSVRIAVAGVGVLIALAAATYFGVIQLTATQFADSMLYVMGAIAVIVFGGTLFFGGLDASQKKRIAVIFVFFLCAAMFWAGFEQAGSTFNFFARDYTDRSWLGSWFEDGQHPASWYQSVQPLFVILLSPVFSWIWISLGRRNLDPSAPLKFGLGLLQLGAGMGVMALAAELVVSSHDKVLPTWLLLTYLIHTTGELCLSPVGLSNVTKLAPPRYVGQMMGTWFLGAAIGNTIAGRVGGEVGATGAESMPGQFMLMLFIGGGAGVLVLLATPLLKRLMGGVK
ncbi:MAG TPA: peptide MFS transporter [Steroidobacteraceae bacterium]|nr:peptide MFS transporter [Steroidobacteraceae bacterium]